jgi:serine/threonine-protein kinase HipA
MAKILDVYLYEDQVGKLVQDKYGEITFTYSEIWLQNPNAISISYSLPLQKNEFTRKECQAFFEGILPEESQRKIIAKNLGISANNDFSMLEKIGGECAGALTFIKSNESWEYKQNEYHELTEEALANILRELPARPLLAGERGVRLSLAGVQDKIVLYVKENKFYVPLASSPSTHILKPDFSIYEGVVFNEDFCMSLARHIELPVADTEIRKISEIKYLLVKRYDRKYSNKLPTDIIRLHQEDFCQALGIPSKNKYQNEQGPSLKHCFDLLRLVSTQPVIELGRLLNAVIFNYLIGNCDAHGKNFSLLYRNGVELAPLYDLICTIYYKDLERKMAMKIGGEYKIDNITLLNFDMLAEEAGFAKSAIHVRIRQVIDAMLAALPKISRQEQIQEDIANIIQNRCESFAKQFK